MQEFQHQKPVNLSCRVHHVTLLLEPESKTSIGDQAGSVEMLHRQKS